MRDEDAKKLKGDAAVKFNFEVTLRDDDGEFVIDTPQTVVCTELYEHQNEEVQALHSECGLLSFQQIQEVAEEFTENFEEIIKDALFDEKYEHIEEFLETQRRGGIMTRSKLFRALEQYQIEVDKRPGDGSEAEQVEISRPEADWPEWLMDRLPHLRHHEEVIEEVPEPDPEPPNPWGLHYY